MKKPVFSLVALFFLAACGGGGGGGGPAPSPSVQPSPSITPLPSPSVIPSPSPTAAPTATPTATPQPTATPTPTPGAGARLSGGIAPANGHFVDSDTNDPDGTPQSNNTVPTAQNLTLPALVAGFVSCARSDAQAPCPDGSDALDVFRAGLVPGQRLILELASNDGDDLDLYVLSETDNNNDGFFDEVARSINAGSRSEDITFEGEAGEYLILVEAFAGASSYLLTLGQPTLAASARPAPFVSGELLVEWKAGTRKKALAAENGLELVQPVAEGPSRYRLGQQKRQPWRRPGDALIARAPADAELNTRMLQKALMLQSAVQNVALNHIRQPLRIPNDRLFNLQWHMSQIQAPQAWELTQGDPSVRIAILDTGIKAQHPDLDSLIDADGFDFISDPFIANDGDGIDTDPDDAGDGERLGESSFHGTHVAGTAAAESDNGIGVAGVNWNSRLVPIRVLGRGGGTDFDIAQGIRYAAGLSNASGQTIAAVDVINMSLGGPGDCASTAYQGAVAAARAAGVIVIAAAGNETTDAPQVPASCEGVVSVSATNILEQLSFYSNFGPAVDVAAPGGDSRLDTNNDGVPDGVLSTFFNEELNEPVFSLLDGTSMAAPHVAGVAALMKSRDASLTPERFDALLSSGALTRDTGSPGRDDQFGHGIIDAGLAVRAVSNQVEPFLSASPESLFIGLGDSATFDLRNAIGQGSINVLSISDDALFNGVDWLEVIPQQVDGSGLGTYLAAVDRSVLPAESASLRATITISADNNQSIGIPVFVTSLAATTPGDLGRVYVLVINADNSVAAETTATRDGDRYSFSIPDLPAGSYRVVAGTDHDGDLEICDPGEACGGFPTLDTLNVIALDADRSLADFAVRLEMTLVANETDGSAKSRARKLGQTSKD